MRGADQVGVAGTLEVHGVTRSLEVEATIIEVTPERAVITADIAGIDRRDWGAPPGPRRGARVINRVTVRAAFTKAA